MKSTRSACKQRGECESGLVSFTMNNLMETSNLYIDIWRLTVLSLPALVGPYTIVTGRVLSRSWASAINSLKCTVHYLYQVNTSLSMSSKKFFYKSSSLTVSHLIPSATLFNGAHRKCWACDCARAQSRAHRV